MMSRGRLFFFLSKTSLRFFGRAAEKMHTSFLERNLKKSRIFLPQTIYLSLLLMAVFCIAANGLLAELILFAVKICFRVDSETAVLLGAAVFFITLFLSLFSAVLFYAFPVFKAVDRRIKTEHQLPFAVHYMNAMAIAGLPIPAVFEAVSKKEMRTVYKEVSEEIRSIDLLNRFFGKDYPTAIEIAANETASPMLADFLNGARNTMISGGSFQKYLFSKQQAYRSRMIRQKEKYFQTLDILSEIYLTVFLAMPLFLMILFLSMMPFSGPQTHQMHFLAYRIVPFLGFFFLTLLEILNEKEAF